MNPISKPAEENYWFKTISDKTNISGSRYCRAHHFPHKLWGTPIVDEPCHYHNNPIRMAHHTPFCKNFLKCQNYDFMISTYRKAKAEEPEKFSIYQPMKNIIKFIQNPGFIQSDSAPDAISILI